MHSHRPAGDSHLFRLSDELDERISTRSNSVTTSEDDEGDSDDGLDREDDSIEGDDSGVNSSNEDGGARDSPEKLSDLELPKE